jgi:hypothetical protein
MYPAILRNNIVVCEITRGVILQKTVCIHHVTAVQDTNAQAYRNRKTRHSKFWLRAWKSRLGSGFTTATIAYKVKKHACGSRSFSCNIGAEWALEAAQWPPTRLGWKWEGVRILHNS